MATKRDLEFAQKSVSLGYVAKEKLLRCARLQEKLEQKGQYQPISQILLSEELLSSEEFDAIQEQCFDSQEISENSIIDAILVDEKQPASDSLGDSFFSDSSGESSEIEAVSESETAIPKNLGPYWLLEKIGRGGSAEVYKAMDTNLDRCVAVKILTNHKFANKALERFLQEAKSIAQLRHTNIITIYYQGTEGDLTYFAMDYIAGGSLKDCLAKKPYSLRDSLEIILKICAAIKCAHETGIIHRDLKPENILMDGKEPKVMDFGLAKLKDSEYNMSRQGSVFGTLRYMPPEQARGEVKAIDERSDVYALGAVLYEMLAGQPAFAGDSSMNLLYRIVSEKPEPLTSLNPKIPKALEIICHKAMAKKRKNRYQSVAEMITALNDFKKHSGKMMPIAKKSKKLDKSSKTNKPSRERKIPQRNSSHNSKIVIGLAVFIAVVIAFMVTWGGKKNPQEKITILKNLSSNDPQEKIASSLENSSDKNTTSTPDKTLAVHNTSALENEKHNQKLEQQALLEYQKLLKIDDSFALWDALQKFSPQYEKTSTGNKVTEHKKQLQQSFMRDLQQFAAQITETNTVQEFVDHQKKLLEWQTHDSLWQQLNSNTWNSIPIALEQQKKSLTKNWQKQCQKLAENFADEVVAKKLASISQQIQQLKLEGELLQSQDLELYQMEQNIKALQAVYACKDFQNKSPKYIFRNFNYQTQNHELFYGLGLLLHYHKLETPRVKKIMARAVREGSSLAQEWLRREQHKKLMQITAPETVYIGIAQKYIVSLPAKNLDHHKLSLKFPGSDFSYSKEEINHNAENIVCTFLATAKSSGENVMAVEIYNASHKIAQRQLKLTVVDNVFGIPIEVWKNCSVVFNGTQVLDTTTKYWQNLSVKEKWQYSKSYQRGYAKKLQKNVETTIKLNGTQFVMVLIPPGRFFVQQRNQNIQRDLRECFWMQKTELTQHQWSSLMNTSPWRNKRYAKKTGDDFPAMYVSWEDTQKLVEQTKGMLRLPTYDEWEYACKAGTTERFFWGSDFSQIDQYAWRQTYSSVAQKASNPWGLYDTIGNVSEWCQELKGNREAFARGGNYLSDENWQFYSSSAWPRFIDRGDSMIGLRLVMSVKN